MTLKKFLLAIAIVAGVIAVAIAGLAAYVYFFVCTGGHGLC